MSGLLSSVEPDDIMRPKYLQMSTVVRVATFNVK